MMREQNRTSLTSDAPPLITYVPNPDPNQAVLAGAGGRPATRDELIEFARENNARVVRERTAR